MYKLTHSLLESWIRATDPEAGEEQYTAFLDTLERKERPKTKAMKDGIAFERLVNNFANKKPLVLTEIPPNEFSAVISFGQRLDGAILQVKAEKELSIAGIPFLLVGVADAIKAGIISDIKRVQRYEYGKYFSSTQHPMYMELFPEAIRFDYLIFDGTYCYREQYRRGDFKPIQEHAAAFVRYLEDADLMDIYKKHWEVKE